MDNIQTIIVRLLNGYRDSYVMRPLRYPINVTLDGCCDHRATVRDEDLFRHVVDNLDRADALLFGRGTYEMMEAAWRPSAVNYFSLSGHTSVRVQSNQNLSCVLRSNELNSLLGWTTQGRFLFVQPQRFTRVLIA
jgi:hypothetical protein